MQRKTILKKTALWTFFAAMPAWADTGTGKATDGSSASGGTTPSPEASTTSTSGQSTAQSTSSEKQATKQNKNQKANTTEKAKTTATSGAVKNRSIEGVVIVLATPESSKKQGCWATIFDGTNFTGRALTLYDDVELSHLEFPVFNDWEGDIDSVMVGPKAKLYLYGSENFKDLDQELNAGEQVKDINHKPAIDAIESARLVCTES